MKYLIENDCGGCGADVDGTEVSDSIVNTTSTIAPFYTKVGEPLKRKRRKYKKMKLKESKKIFSTIDIRESKLTKNEYEGLLHKHNTIIVPIDEDQIEYKLLNFDEYGRVYENHIVANHIEKKIYIEANSKETVNYLLMESNRSRYNYMRLPEMKHIFGLCKSIVEGYRYTIIHNSEEYNIKF